MTTSYQRFLLIWAGQLVARLGNSFGLFIIGAYLITTALNSHGSASGNSAYSLLLACAFAPQIILAPLGGLLADKYSRKWLMLAADFSAGIIWLIAVWGWFFMDSPLWLLYLAMALSSLFNAAHSPALKSALTDLVAPEQYSKAAGMMQLAEASRYLLAPIFAGWLFGLLPMEHLLGMVTGSYLIAAVTLVILPDLKPQAGTEDAVVVGLKAVVGKIIKSRQLITLLKLTFFLTFFTGVFQALAKPAMLTVVSPKLFGSLQSAAALGMLISSLYIGMRKPVSTGNESALKYLVFPLALFGSGFVLFGVSTDIMIMTIALFIIFSLLPPINTFLEVSFRNLLDSNIQGRAWSVISFASQLGLLLALSLSGIVADYLIQPFASYFNSILPLWGSTQIPPGSVLIILSGISLLCLAFTSVPKKASHAETESLQAASK